MEGLLLVLFLLFSVATALLERRKRRQQLEEAKERQQQQRERGEMAPTALEEEEEVDEEWGGWPFPSGDPFEQPQAKPVARRVAPTEAMPPATTDAQILLAEIEREASARQRQARQVRPARSVAELIGQRRGTSSPRDAKSRRRANGYKLTPEKARLAVVYAELLGPCKAEREEEWRW